VSSFDRARDAVDFVTATIDSLAGVVENAIFSVNLVDGGAPASGIVFTEDITKIADQQVDMLYGMACLLSASSPACDNSTRNGSIGSTRATHRHKMTTSRAMCRALRATDARSRCPFGVRALIELGFAAAFQAKSARSQRSDGGEEPVGGRQRDMVDEILRGGDGTPVEGCDPPRRARRRSRPVRRLEVPG